MADKHTKEMYTNHRSRLRERYAAGGADSFDDYLLMELLLFDFIPRVDTYPTAHRLIDSFGSLTKVFEAPREELLKIKGIGPKTADKIVLWKDIIERTVAEHLCADSMTSENGAAPYLLWTFRFLDNDSSCLLLLDSKGRLTERNVFPKYDGKDGSVLVAVENILKTRKAKYAILAHKHPKDLTEPSGNDLAVTDKFFSLCKESGCIPLAHYIVTDTSVNPIKRSL